MEVLTSTIKQEKEVEGIRIRKEEIKLSLFEDGVNLYVEALKDSTKKLLDLINGLSKAEGYKINIQKLVVFLTMNFLKK